MARSFSIPNRIFSRRIISGSCNGVIRAWDVISSAPIGEPVEEHITIVSQSYSLPTVPESSQAPMMARFEFGIPYRLQSLPMARGTRIISGSCDKTVHLGCRPAGIFWRVRYAMPRQSEFGMPPHVPQNGIALKPGLGSSFVCHPGDSADDHIDLCEVITLADEAICLATGWERVGTMRPGSWQKSSALSHD